MVTNQTEKLRERFGLRRLVLVGDRGMLTQTQIEKLRGYLGLGWISVLRADGIRKLVQGLEATEKELMRIGRGGAADAESSEERRDWQESG